MILLPYIVSEIVDVNSASFSCNLSLYFLSFRPILIIKTIEMGIMIIESSVSFQLRYNAIRKKIISTAGSFRRLVNVTEIVFCKRLTSVTSLDMISPARFSLKYFSDRVLNLRYNFLLISVTNDFSAY